MGFHNYMYLSSFDIKKPPSSVETRTMIGGTNKNPIVAAKYIVETGIKNISIAPIIPDTNSSLKFIFLRYSKNVVDGSTSTVPLKHAS